MDSGNVLGSVEVEVRANLDKLTTDFARGRAQTQAFAKDLSDAGNRGMLNLTSSMKAVNGQTTKWIDNMVTVNRYQRELEDAQIKAEGTWANATKVIAANRAAIQAMTRATNPAIASQRTVSAALRDVERQYKNGEVSIAALTRAQQMAAPYIQNTAQKYEQLAQRFQPLRAAQAKYTADLALINTAEKAGIASGAEAAAMRAQALASFNALSGGAEKAGINLSGWARSTEHHLRAMRLLLTFVGVDLAGRLGEFAIKTLESTAAIKDQADQLRLSTSELQEYRLVAGQVGMTAADMDSAFQTLGKNLDDMRLGRVGPFSKLMQRLGVDISDAAGKVRPTSAIFSDLINKLGDVGDQAQRQGAQEIAFGEAGQKMGQMVKMGATNVDALREAMRQTGMILSDEQIQNADKTAKKLDQVKNVLSVKFASIVVDNAAAISTLADAVGKFVASGLQNAVATISSFIARMQELYSILSRFRAFMGSYGAGMEKGGTMSLPDLIGKDFWGNTAQSYRDGTWNRGKSVQGYGKAGQSVTVQLPEAKPAERPHGSNVKLDGLLSPKGKKQGQEKYDQYEADLLREKQRQLELEREATGDLQRQNEIDHELIDLKLGEQIENIKKQVHSKQLTAAEGKKLEAEARITADMEKEAADRKMRVALIEQQNQYADEIARLLDDGLQTARALARTDEERKKIDLAILDSKQQQAVSELQKEIALAKEAKNEQRVLELTEEMAKLKANQLQEQKQFGVDHLTRVDKFKNDLPRTPEEYSDKIKDMAFDLFNQKLQQAAQFAGDVGDAFGQAAGELAQFKNPLQVFKDLLGNLAQTFTKNFIEKPVSEWATQHIGAPLAKQGFGKDLDKLAQKAGSTALTTQQMNTALAIATGNLNMLAAAAASASAAMSAQGVVSGAGGIGGLLNFGGLGSGISTGIDFGGVSTAGLGSALDFSSTLSMSLAGFAGGGYTGDGPPNKVKGFVHAGEWVWDAPTTKRIMPVLKMMGMNKQASFSGGLARTLGGGKTGPDNHYHFGDIHVHGATDDRSARRSGRQALGEIQRGLGRVNRTGLNR